ATRKRHKAFGRGSMEFLHPENRKILAFVRRYEDETLLIVANLSRIVQCFELDLSEFRGMVPVELSGGTKFPEIGERPYFLNLGPFAFYWFELRRQAAPQIGDELPLVNAKKWDEIFSDRNRDALQRAIGRYIRTRRWFAGKARTINTVTIRDTVQLSREAGQLAIVDIDYTDAEPEAYLLPLGVTAARRSDESDARTATL